MKKSNQKSKRGVMLLVVAVCAMLIIIAAEAFGGFTFSYISEKFTGFFSSVGEGGGFPYTFSSDMPKLINSDGSDIVLLSDLTVKRMNSDAKIVSNVRHSYSNPAVSSMQGKSIIYDAGKDKYRIAQRKNISDEQTAAGEILVCEMGKNGSFAIASRAPGTSSSLSVYNKNFKEIFKWNSSSDHIVDIALSDNGKRAASAALGVKNGEIYSVVHIFDINGTEPLAKYEFSGSTVAHIDFTSDGSLVIAGDNVFSVISKNAQEEKYRKNYAYGTLKCLDFSNKGETVTVYSKYAADGNSVVEYSNKKGNVIASLEIKENINSAAAFSGGFALLFDSQVITYKTDGSENARIDLEENIEKIFYCGSSLYGSNSGKIILLTK